MKLLNGAAKRKVYFGHRHRVKSKSKRSAGWGQPSPAVFDVLGWAISGARAGVKPSPYGILISGLGRMMAVTLGVPG